MQEILLTIGISMITSIITLRFFGATYFDIVDKHVKRMMDELKETIISFLKSTRT